MTATKQHKNLLPDFKSREEMAHFWDTHDFTDYQDDFKPVELDVALEQPKQETVVVRLHTSIKNTLQKVAQRKGLTISSLARMWLMEKLQTTH